MDMLNLLEGIAAFRCVTVPIVASTWYAHSASVTSARTLANSFLRLMREQELIDSVPYEGRKLGWIITRKGEDYLKQRSQTIATNQRFLLSSSNPTISTHMIVNAQVLARLARTISDIPSMHFVCRCESLIASHPSLSSYAFADAVIGIVSSSYHPHRLSMATRGPGRPTSAESEVHWTSWKNVMAVIEANMRGDFREIAGYYALETDRGTESVLSFRQRAETYRHGRMFPPPDHMPSAPIPIIVTTTAKRAKAIVASWRDADPRSMVFAIDMASLRDDNPITSPAWVSYLGDEQSSSEIGSISPFRALERHRQKRHNLA